jgi:hypothetical protein
MYSCASLAADSLESMALGVDKTDKFIDFLVPILCAVVTFVAFILYTKHQIAGHEFLLIFLFATLSYIVFKGITLYT